MKKFNKNMTDDEFLQELKQLDTTEVIEAFNKINESSYEIHYAGDFIEMLSCGEDIRYLLELQSALPCKNLYDYDYILTGDYYADTNADDDIFDLLDDDSNINWLDCKDELIEYLMKEDI